MVQEVLMYKSESGPAFETREEAEEHDREEAWFNFAVRVLPLALEPRVKRRVAQLLRANAADLRELLDNFGEVEVTPPPEEDETPPLKE